MKDLLLKSTYCKKNFARRQKNLEIKNMLVPIPLEQKIWHIVTKIFIVKTKFSDKNILYNDDFFSLLKTL